MQTPDLTLCCQCGVGLLGFSRVQASLPENGEGYPACPPAWLMAHVFSFLLTLGGDWRWGLMGEEKVGRREAVPRVASVLWPRAVRTTCAVWTQCVPVFQELTF